MDCSHFLCYASARKQTTIRSQSENSCKIGLKHQIIVERLVKAKFIAQSSRLSNFRHFRAHTMLLAQVRLYRSRDCGKTYLPSWLAICGVQFCQPVRFRLAKYSQVRGLYCLCQANNSIKGLRQYCLWMTRKTSISGVEINK